MNFVMTAGRVSVSVGCLLAVLVLCAPVAQAQTLIIYDDALQNGFEDYSYPFGTANFNDATAPHSGVPTNPNHAKKIKHVPTCDMNRRSPRVVSNVNMPFLGLPPGERYSHRPITAMEPKM